MPTIKLGFPYRTHMSLFRLLAVLALVAAPLTAQERFDIAVYPYATAARGEWELEALVNYASRGTSAFDGGVAPTQGQWRFASELTRGITDHWELAAYVLGAQVPGLGLEYAGWRARSRMRAPEQWGLPVNLGLGIEYEAARPAFSESAQTLELTAILERRVGALRLIVDPTFERDFQGPEHEWEFEPRARAGYRISKTVTLGLEYYGAFVETEAKHQVYPTADFRLGDDANLHVGVGFGSRNSGDRLVFKTGFEIPLGGDKD